MKSLHHYIITSLHRYIVTSLHRYIVNREIVKSSMDPDKRQIRTFEDLEAYKVAREFRKSMYQVARELPEIEKYALASQIRRAAVSLTNNIAEGHGRYHWLDQIKFLLQSRDSLQKLIDDLIVCEDENYLTVGDELKLREHSPSLDEADLDLFVTG